MKGKMTPPSLEGEGVDWRIEDIYKYARRKKPGFLCQAKARHLGPARSLEFIQYKGRPFQLADISNVLDSFKDFLNH